MGIDGGGSKTEALLQELETKHQITLYSGGINSITDGMDRTYPQLQSLIQQIKNKLDEEEGEIVGICIGSASIVSEGAQDWSCQALSEAFPNATVNGVIDSRIAAEGALDEQPGVVIVAGTGSIGYSLAFDGTVNRCGGWGPLFGDEGSGYWIGCEALRSIAMEMDGRGESTRLTERLRAQLQIRQPTDLIERIYNRMGRKEIASLAVTVALCAAEKDSVSLEIVNHAAKHLASILLSLIKQTDWDSPPVLSYVGGVFQMGDLILSPLKAHLGEWSVMLKEPKSSPSYGAVMLALKAQGKYNR